MQLEVSTFQFNGSIDFDFFENLPNEQTNYLLYFDDSCEVFKSKQFQEVVFAGKHGKLNFFSRKELVS